MLFALAENPRTIKKATIKRASARARLNMNDLDRSALNQLDNLYRTAASDIEAAIQSYAGLDGSLRLDVLQDLQGQVNTVLQQLRDARQLMLDNGLEQASVLGVQPYTGYINGQTLSRVADDSVRFTRSFVASDGLQLSDRIWRIDNHAREAVSGAINNAIIQGHSASQAANDFLSRGLPVPADVQNKMGVANASNVGRMASTELLTGNGSPRYNAMRVFRTEINRAHGEAYMASGENDEDFAGWKFLLSPRHPEPDICDMHSRVNRYGLGPGVYPSRESTPWPAHPNTLSYVEVVFKDEVTEEDKAGKTNRIDWLKGQAPNVQKGVLGANQKKVALQRGILKENEISSPWYVLKKKYQRNGIDVSSLVIEKEKPITFGGTRIYGIDPAELKAYTDTALKKAPTSIMQLIEKSPKPANINVIPSGVSYYQGGSITLAKTSMRDRVGIKSKHDVYLHEYGHFIDFNAKGKQLSYMPNTSGGLKDSIDKAKKSLHARTPAQKDRRNRINHELIKSGDGFLADLFGALTLNKTGYGHSKAYLSRPAFSETEVFANLFDLYAREDQSGWAYITQELPDLAYDFVQFIEELIK